jgi:hypothetical protein
MATCGSCIIESVTRNDPQIDVLRIHAVKIALRFQSELQWDVAAQEYGHSRRVELGNVSPGRLAIHLRNIPEESGGSR